MTIRAFSPSDSGIAGKTDPEQLELGHFIQDKVSIEAAALKQKRDGHDDASRSLPSRRTKLLVVAFVIMAAGVGGFVWSEFGRRGPVSAELLVVHGNIDLRQVALPFNNNERIAAVLVQEGDVVRKGDLLARLDTSRLEPQVAQAAAQVAAQRAAVARLHNGSRPEEIAQAKANLDSAKANAINARKQLERRRAMLPSGGAAQQDVDTAMANAGVADAQVEVNQKALDLAVLGPRREDIDQGEAQLRGNEAQLAFLRQQLADAELRAPVDAVVRSRLMEPGEMASPQRPVLSLAIVNPKWVRTYVSEPDLAKTRTGMRAHITVDSFPGRQFDGWIGFVSPVAEFTPKNVETSELRTSLLFEVRVFVNDPGNELPLGMPATVDLMLDAGRTHPTDTR